LQIHCCHQLVMIIPNVWQMEYMLKHTIFSPISNNVDMESVLFLVFLEHK
jgi:hypothetical protein